MSRRTVLLIAVAGVVAISVTALTVVPPTWTVRGAALTASAADAEYDEERQRLDALGYDLAPGWVWPAQAGFEAEGPDGAPMTYEEGCGAVRADMFWFYSWAEWAVLAGDGATVEGALDRLDGMRELALYRERLPEDRAYLDLMLDEARRGDLSKLAEYVEANAPIGAIPLTQEPADAP